MTSDRYLLIWCAERRAAVDLRCDSEIASCLLHDTNSLVVGINQSESFLEMARKKIPDAEFRAGSFVAVPVGESPDVH
jgi:hypothetical protein